MCPYIPKPLLACLFAISLFFPPQAAHAQPAGASRSNASSPRETQRETLEIQRLMRQGELQQALEKADRLIAASPRDAQGRFLKGLILTEMNRLADAVNVFTRMTEDFPELPEPYNNLAVLYARQKQYDRARAALEMAIRTHPSYSVAHENLGDIYAALASQAYGKALQLDASNAATQTKLSMIREIMGAPASSHPKTAADTRSASATQQAALAGSSTPAAPPPKTASTEPPAELPKTSAPATPSSSSATALPVKTPVATEADVAEAVRAWARAWSKKDVAAYLAHYADDFQLPRGMTRSAWKTERTQRIGKPGKIQVSVENLRVLAEENKTVTVKFRQHYASDTLKSAANKTLVFTLSENRWLIRQERID